MMERCGDFSLDSVPTREYEGGWANTPGDKGGETIFGIARNFNPSWPGWALVDGMRTSPSFPSGANSSGELKRLARDFYQEFYWDAIHGDELPWRYSAALFDMAVNSCAPGNPKVAVRQLQAALNYCGANLIVDGSMGEQTVKACWDSGKGGVEEFLTARIMFYADIMMNNSTQRMWARNWLKRVIVLADYALED